MAGLHRRLARAFIALALAGSGFAGCVSPRASVEDARPVRYRPDESGRNPSEWLIPSESVAVVPATPSVVTNAAPAEVAVAPAAIVASAVASPTNASPPNASPPNAPPTNAPPAPPAGTGVDGPPALSPTSEYAMKALGRGDSLSIFLRSIPKPEEIKTSVDSQGEVNLPLVKRVKLEGMTTAQAEHHIERAYIDGGFYSKITVTVVAQPPEFFVRGEVKREGKYAMTGEMTLLQAITEAGGYTEYAKPTRVRIIRKEEVQEYDATRIEEGREKDPLIKAGDLIVVPRGRI